MRRGTDAGRAGLADVAGGDRVAAAVEREVARVAQQHLHRPVHLLEDDAEHLRFVLFHVQRREEGLGHALLLVVLH